MIADSLEPLFWTLFGLSLGSFVNVVIHRLPRSRSLFYPASHCPKCRKPIVYRDNIPVLAYLFLRGRCRDCGKKISPRYPAVEALLGGLGLALSLRYPGDNLWLLLILSATAVLVSIAFIDWDTFLIPNELSLGLVGVGLLAAPFNPFFRGAVWERLLLSAASALGGLCLCWAIAALGEVMFKKEAMGGGDIKLLAGVGAWSGILGAYDCLIIGSFLGAVYGAYLLMVRKATRQDPIPFGPFLSAAAVFNFFHLLPFGWPLN